MTHDPSVSTSLTVRCAQNATLDDPDPDGGVQMCPTVADLEVFCSALRGLGAGDDLPVPGAIGLSLTLKR